MKIKCYCLTAFLLLAAAATGYSGEKQSVVAPGAQVIKLAGGFSFTEGPASDAAGNVFFTDIPNNRIHKWSLDGKPLRGKLTIFRKNSGGANGLFFDKSGNLLACEGGGRRLVSISKQGKVRVLAEEYRGKQFNSLNDLWIDPKGGIYFTDPRYGSRDDMQQGGEHVYYLSPGRKEITRVINDMVRPNGVIGTPDGKILYVTDHGGGKTFKYSINKDGTLSNKKLFAPEGSDGMTIDNQGNVYLTTRGGVAVYNKKGEKVEVIEIPEGPANVCFGGKDKSTLFITARTSLYSVRMRVRAAEREPSAKVLRIRRTEDFVVNGRGDATAWKKTAWEPLNLRTADGHKYKTKVKMLYSRTGLYVLMEAEDRKITATMKADFLDLWNEDVFEFFLWPDERYPVYFEYEISPLGFELPILIPNFGGEFLGWRPWHYENERLTQTATTVVGGPKRSGARITGWKAEVYVPYDLLKPLQNVPPQPGTRWRANFYRVDYDDGRSTSWDWARVGGSFHEFEKFGTFIFE